LFFTQLHLLRCTGVLRRLSHFVITLVWLPTAFLWFVGLRSRFPAPLLRCYTVTYRCCTHWTTHYLHTTLPIHTDGTTLHHCPHSPPYPCIYHSALHTHTTLPHRTLPPHTTVPRLPTLRGLFVTVPHAHTFPGTHRILHYTYRFPTVVTCPLPPPPSPPFRAWVWIRCRVTFTRCHTTTDGLHTHGWVVILGYYPVCLYRCRVYTRSIARQLYRLYLRVTAR